MPGARAAARALRARCGATRRASRRARARSRARARARRWRSAACSIRCSRPHRGPALRVDWPRCSTRAAPPGGAHDGAGTGTPELSAIVIAKNNERTIARCIESLAWADEIIVVDSGSTDRTLEICRALGAQVHVDDRLAGPRPAEESRARPRDRRVGALDRLRRVGDAGAARRDRARDRVAGRARAATRSRGARASAGASCSIRAGGPTTCCVSSGATPGASPTITRTSASS